MRSLLIFLPVCIFISGCASEVDKCVEGYMKVYEQRPPGEKSQAGRAEYEANMRYLCLKASGKSN